MNASRSGDRWRIGLTSRAAGQYEKFKRNPSSQDIIWTKFRELSNGKFTLDNHSVIIGTSTHIPIYKARLSNDLRIIYHIDIVPNKQRKFDRQVIKVLYIDKRAHIDYGFWTKVSALLRRQNQSKDYRDRCKFRLPSTSSSQYTLTPAQFPHNPSAASMPPGADVEGSVLDELQAAIGSGPCVAVSKALYEGAVETNTCEPSDTENAGAKTCSKDIHPVGRVNLPPDPDPHQYEIITHRGASIVVGRSGTGKTTALIYKMHGVESSATGHVRQLFVTRSRVLARHVESSFSRLSDSVNLEVEDTREPGKTSTELDQAVVEFDNEIDLRTDLPPRFSELEDHHFPLFVSFEKLCALIEADMRKDQEEEERYVWTPKPLWERTKIDYDKFKAVYWPQFKNCDRISLNPFLVYTEILGAIKGYSEVMGSNEGYLTKDQYLLGDATRKVSAHLDINIKQQIYSLFEQYRQLKGARLELDSADRSHHMLDCIRQVKPKKKEGDSECGAEDVEEERLQNVGRKPSALVLQPKHAEKKKEEKLPHLLECLESISFLYVDEVQDNLMTDVQLLKELCGNVNNTYWGGDTAQTILAGSGFRIKDLGSYIYTEANGQENRNPRLPSNSRPTKFELLFNYRSHDGIVQCAASVVDSLYALFPESLDRLARETGNIKSTELPIVLTNTSSEPAMFADFLMRATSSIGAQQAILVRSEQLAKELESSIDEFCPILTIANCKGLEFDDIIIYNFFTESECSDGWEFVHGISKKGHRSGKDVLPPLSLCNELKLLYVAITRARNRCWFWDHGHLINAMAKYWESKSLIKTMLVTAVTGWGRTSDPSQWILKGQEYFSNRMYKLAAGCFKRGGNRAETDYKIASAYYRMSKAKLEMLRSDTDSAKNALRAAAAELKDCTRLVAAQNTRTLWFHSAICLELVGDVQESASAFVNADLVERAIRALINSDRIAQCVEILVEHGHKLGSRVQEEFLDYCRLYYLEKGRTSALPPLFAGDVDLMLAFTRKRGFREQLKILLERYKRLDELARVFLDEKTMDKALDTFIRAFEYHKKQSSIREGASIAITQAEWIFTLDSRRNDFDMGKVSVLTEKALQYASQLDPATRKVLRFFHIVLESGGKLNPDTAKDWDEHNPDQALTKALILHESLRETSWTASRELRIIMSRLNTWKVFNVIISKVAESAEPSKMIAARRLFGIKSSGSELFVTPNYVVAEGSLLAQSTHKYPFKTSRNSNNELLIPASWVDRIVKDRFRDTLDDRLRNIYFGLVRSGWISLNSFKPRASGPSSMQMNRAITSDKHFSNRLNVVNVAIEAFSPLCDVPFTTTPSRSNPSINSLWIHHLFNTIYPMNGTFEEFTTARVRRSQTSYPGVRKCIKRHVIETSSTDIWMLVVAYSLVAQLDACNPVLNKTLNSPSEVFVGNRLSEKSMINTFFNWEEPRGLAVINYGLREIMLETEEPLDGLVVVHLIELITCEVIFHLQASRSTSQSGFAGLILPYSWARWLSKRYGRACTPRDTDSLDILFEIMIWACDSLKSHNLNRWWIGSDLLYDQPETRDILQLRLCWCAALILVNSPDPPMGFADTCMQSLVHMAYDPYHRIEIPLYRKFSTVIDQQSCLQALCGTFNRETLVRLSHQGQPRSSRRGQKDIVEVLFTSSIDVWGALKRCLKS